MTLRLGKREAQYDPKTLAMAEFMAPPAVPSAYDLDKGRRAFPLDAWGNDAWGNCVKVGQANQLIRLERLEQRRTLKLTSELVIQAYKDEVLAEFNEVTSNAGDANDNGLIVLYNIRNWRTTGWTLDFTKKANDARVYKIAAFGELHPEDYEQLKAACYLLHGVQLGLWLPRGIQGNYTKWDYAGENGPEWQPGSWGGHLVYAKAYDGDEFEILTWGMKVRVTKSFLAKYCDEAYAVVDDFDNWRKSKIIDVEALKQALRDIGASGIE